MLGYTAQNPPAKEQGGSDDPPLQNPRPQSPVPIASRAFPRRPTKGVFIRIAALAALCRPLALLYLAGCGSLGWVSFPIRIFNSRLLFSTPSPLCPVRSSFLSGLFVTSFLLLHLFLFTLSPSDLHSLSFASSLCLLFEFLFTFVSFQLPTRGLPFAQTARARVRSLAHLHRFHRDVSKPPCIPFRRASVRSPRFVTAHSLFRGFSSRRSSHSHLVPRYDFHLQ